MNFQTLSDYMILPRDIVSVKKMNNIYELCYVEHRNTEPKIKKLNNDSYLVLSTGEVKQCNHIENRSESKMQVAQSLKRLRDYINTNVIEPDNCKWITLTYKENMTDTKRLYIDFKNFIKRFKYYYGKFEYIACMEPQGRGAWHCHLIAIFDKKAPYIPNKDLQKIWSFGFTKTKKLNNVDNIGAYITAYLGDIEYNDKNIEEISKLSKNNIKLDIKEVSDIEGVKLKTPKKFIKGGRLYLYPPHFNLYRISKGIKKPEKHYHTYNFIKEKAELLNPTYSKAISLTSTDNNFSNKIIYEYYNTKRK